MIEPFAIIFWPTETVGGWSNTDGCLLIEQDLIYSASVHQTNAFLALCLSISTFFVSVSLFLLNFISVLITLLTLRNRAPVRC